MKAMIRMRLPLGKVLMHKNTYIDSLKLKTEDIGFAPQEARFNRGVEGEETFLGLPVVTTIKDNLVKENEIFFFTQPEFFIKFFFLQDATLFMKTEADLIHFHTYESPGIGIGNRCGQGHPRIALREMPAGLFIRRHFSMQESKGNTDDRQYLQCPSRDWSLPHPSRQQVS